MTLPEETAPNKQLDLTKSVLAMRTTAFAGQLRRSADVEPSRTNGR